MKDFSKFQGIIPAFYACYDEEGAISPDAVRSLTRYFIQKGVKGVYVGGSPVNVFTRAWPSASWCWKT